MQIKIPIQRPPDGPRVPRQDRQDRQDKTYRTNRADRTGSTDRTDMIKSLCRFKSLYSGHAINLARLGFWDYGSRV